MFVIVVVIISIRHCYYLFVYFFLFPFIYCAIIIQKNNAHNHLISASWCVNTEFEWYVQFFLCPHHSDLYTQLLARLSNVLLGKFTAFVSFQFLALPFFSPANATTHWRITHYAPYSHFALCYCAHKFTLLLFYYLYKYNLVWLCAITSSLFFLFLSLCVCGVFFLLLLSLFNKNIYRQMILIVIYTNIDLCVLFSACVVCICMSMWA